MSVLRGSVAVVVFLIGCASGTRGPRPLGAPAPAGSADARVELVHLTDRLFAAEQAKDTSALRAMFLPEAVLVAVGRNVQGPVRSRTLDVFLQAVASRQDAMSERLRKPTTLVDGDLAVLSGSYVAYAGGEYSHCGHDTFHFARLAEGWRIAAITYTVARGPCV